jgi:hypothetical protein
MSFSRGSDAQAAAERYDLTLWSECKEARLASRTQRLPRLLEQKILRRSVLIASAEKSDRADSEI